MTSDDGATKHTDLIVENDRLRECCIKRGAQLKLIRDYLYTDQNQWRAVCAVLELHEWFDDQGFPL